MSWPCCCLYLTPHPFTDSFQFIHSLKIVVSRRNFLVWNILEKGLSLPKESWKMHDLFFSDHFQSDWGLWFKNAFYFLRGKMTVTDKIGCLQGICHQFSGQCIAGFVIFLLSTIFGGIKWRFLSAKNVIRVHIRDY